MILGIVGAEDLKFTVEGERRAKEKIRSLILEYRPAAVSSGHCPLGGVDIWAEEIAKELGCFRQRYIFAPKNHRWKPEGFEERNIKIAVASDIVVCLAVSNLPPEFNGRKFPICYHCKPRQIEKPHVKSGGCWTMHYCATLGKIGRLIVVRN